MGTYLSGFVEVKNPHNSSWVFAGEFLFEKRRHIFYEALGYDDELPGIVPRRGLPVDLSEQTKAHLQGIDWVNTFLVVSEDDLTSLPWDDPVSKAFQESHCLEPGTTWRSLTRDFLGIFDRNKTYQSINPDPCTDTLAFYWPEGNRSNDPLWDTPIPADFHARDPNVNWKTWRDCGQDIAHTLNTAPERRLIYYFD